MSPYSPTARLLALASTVGGQRQLLKRPIPVVQFIRQAVETGVYRTPEEMLRIRKERRDGIEDIRVIMNRFRQDIIRGSNIQDYPTEYFILEQHPPIPDPPRTPKRIWNRTVQAKPNPVDKLTRKYMSHLEKNDPHAATALSSAQRRTPPPDTHGGPASSEEYYRRLLGVQAADTLRNSSHNTSGILNLQQKPALVQKAYAAAVLHHHLQRQKKDQSEAEVMAQVDALLAQQTAHEQRVSAERRQNIVQHARGLRSPAEPREITTATTTKTSFDAFPFAPPELDAATEVPPQDATDHAASEAAKEHSYDSIFSSDPMTIQGMMRWSERLQAVPYKEWTVGASTALDHWIARQVLQLSEETWQSLLEGTDPALLSMGRDIIACREAVFPETALHPTRVQQEMYMAREEEETAAMSESMDSAAVDADKPVSPLETATVNEDKEARTIEDLLQRLGGLRPPDAPRPPVARADPKVDEWSAMMDASNLKDLDVDAQIDQLVRELQNWRRRNMETPYDRWDPEDQHRFDSWMKTFVYTVSSEAERRRIRRNSGDAVDYEETRLALLADPPVSPEESNAFWSQLRDESTVEALLDHMVEDGPPPGASILQASFWDLPRDVQLERLVNLGAIRPLLDEYTKETNRLRFLQRYGDIILTGVPLEHLVPDPAGPIRAADLSREIVATLRISEYERFRMERLPYKAFSEKNATEETKAQRDAFEKSRLLFKAWNEHKAGRARYEEKLFQTGRLGLRYSDSMDDEKKRSKENDSSTKEKK